MQVDERAQFTAEASVLQTLPIPVQLIALATRYLAAAHSLTPSIAERPSGDGDDLITEETEHADYISTYRRYIEASLTCCKAVLDGGKDPSRPQDYDARYELRARAMLAELLVRETKDSANAELHIAKGVGDMALRKLRATS